MLRSRATLATLTLAAVALLPPGSALADSTTPPTGPDDLVAHHLDSVGDAKTRAAAKTRVAQGTAQFKILVGGAGTLDGKSALVSEGGKFHFMMKFPNNDYKGEQFIYDGNKIEVSGSTAQQRRSSLGGFVYVQEAVMREGLWGGVLSTAWPLTDLDKRKAKISFDGMKKVDGQDLYEVRYHPKKNTDLEIRLYFDPATYHHVLTVYSLTMQPSVMHVEGSETMSTPETAGGPPLSANSETLTARQQQTRYRLEERFDDFKSADGLTLPTRYTIHFTQELQSGRTTVSEWVIQEENVANNQTLDPKNFEVH